MYGRYVVGIDGSAPSAAALVWAAARAGGDGVPLVVAHVEEPEGGVMGPDFARADLRDGSALLTEVAGSLEGRGTDISTALLSGFVPWALADATRPGDLLVVGTHKTGFLRGRVLGSRSVQIAAAARCAVAVIPDADLRHRTGVVVGLGVGDPPAVLAVAAEEAHRYGQTLTVIPSHAPAGANLTQLSPLIDAVRTTHQGLEIHAKESGRAPAEALLDASRDKALLVIGPAEADGTGNPIGSLLHDVLLNLNSPVLVARGFRN